MAGVPWDPTGVLQDERNDGDGAHNHNPILPPIADAPPQYRFGQHPQSTSRSSISDLFLPQGVEDFPHSSDRPMHFPRDEPQYTYAQSPMTAGHGSNHMRNLSSSTSGSLSDSMQEPQGMTYGLRRSITAPQHLRPIVDNLPHLPYPQQTASSIRLPPNSGLPYPSPGYG